MSLTKNFTLAELVYSDTAKARGIDNSLPSYLMRNAQTLAERLQAIRDTLGVSITISSGYRCPELNKAVGGTKSSQHQLSLAADIHAKGYTAQELFKFIYDGNFSFDQLILEKVGGKEWVHISVQPQERNDGFSITD
jgi:zinc D-Ala-D-Ala carboxypeptidase